MVAGMSKHATLCFAEHHLATFAHALQSTNASRYVSTFWSSFLPMLTFCSSSHPKAKMEPVQGAYVDLQGFWHWLEFDSKADYGSWSHEMAEIQDIVQNLQQTVQDDTFEEEREGYISWLHSVEKFRCKWKDKRVPWHVQEMVAVVESQLSVSIVMIESLHVEDMESDSSDYSASDDDDFSMITSYRQITGNKLGEKPKKVKPLARMTARGKAPKKPY